VENKGEKVRKKENRLLKISHRHVLYKRIPLVKTKPNPPRKTAIKG
jgi:hypothetical protein